MASQKFSIDGDYKGSAPHNQEENTKRFPFIIAFHAQIKNTKVEIKFTRREEDKELKVPISPLLIILLLQFLSYLIA